MKARIAYLLDLRPILRRLVFVGHLENRNMTHALEDHWYNKGNKTVVQRYVERWLLEMRWRRG